MHMCARNMPDVWSIPRRLQMVFCRPNLSRLYYLTSSGVGSYLLACSDSLHGKLPALGKGKDFPRFHDKSGWGQYLICYSMHKDGLKLALWLLPIFETLAIDVCNASSRTLLNKIYWLLATDPKRLSRDIQRGVGEGDLGGDLEDALAYNRCLLRWFARSMRCFVDDDGWGW